MMMLGRLIAILLLGLNHFSSYASNESEDFSIVGVWMLKSELDPKGRESIYAQYTRCKIYDADSTYYSVQLHAVGEDMMIIAHEMGRYHLDDSVYIENGRVMPFKVINDSTYILEFQGYKETMVRSNTMTEERKEEIRELVRKYPNDGDTPVKHFVLSTGERKLKDIISTYHYVFIILVLVVLLIIAIALNIAYRKRLVEQSLSAILEELESRPAPVTDAMKHVSDNFFMSDYYNAIRPRLEAGDNLSAEDWNEMESQLNAVYTGFSRKLRSLHRFSEVEFQVCMLIKLCVSNRDIAMVVNRAPDSVSSIRSRLHKKVLGPDGGAKEWDEFVLSL